MVRETACLTREDRGEVDARMADRIAVLSDAALVAEARRHAYPLDPVAFLNRGKHAETDRHVTARPAPDTMSRLSALLPCRPRGRGDGRPDPSGRHLPSGR